MAKTPRCDLKFGTEYCNQPADHNVVIGGKEYTLCPLCFSLVERAEQPTELPTATDIPLILLRRQVNRWRSAAKKWPGHSPERQACFAKAHEYEQATMVLEQAMRLPWA